MEMDSIYTGLQKPSEDVYSTINQPQGKRAGAQQGVSPVQPSSCSSITIALGVTVCVLLVAVIGMGIAILQIQGTHCVAGNSSTASQTSTNSYMKNSNGLVRSFCWDQDNGDEADLCEICPRTWRWKYNGSCYDFSLIPQSWVSSSNTCSKDGGHLVVIDDQQELHFLRGKMVGGTFYWIGLKGKVSLEEWRWVDNTTFNETLFAFNNTDHRGRDCVIISNTKKYSEPCETGRPRICERKALRLSPNP